MKLDAYDRKILAALQRDGRLSNVQLAEEIGLSASPCLRRVRMLEEAGVIRGYQANLDRDEVGLGLTVFVGVKVERHNDEQAEVFSPGRDSIAGGDFGVSGVGGIGFSVASGGTGSTCLRPVSHWVFAEAAGGERYPQQLCDSYGEDARGVAVGAFTALDRGDFFASRLAPTLECIPMWERACSAASAKRPDRSQTICQAYICVAIPSTFIAA